MMDAGREDRPPRVQVNGEWRDLAVADLSELLAEIGLTGERRGVAVAVNGQVVSRKAWGGHALRDGDQIEVIEAVQGG